MIYLPHVFIELPTVSDVCYCWLLKINAILMECIMKCMKIISKLLPHYPKLKCCIEKFRNKINHNITRPVNVHKTCATETNGFINSESHLMGRNASEISPCIRVNMVNLYY